MCHTFRAASARRFGERSGRRSTRVIGGVEANLGSDLDEGPAELAVARPHVAILEERPLEGRGPMGGTDERRSEDEPCAGAAAAVAPAAPPSPGARQRRPVCAR